LSNQSCWGLPLGGWVALTIAVRHPEMLGGLILYSTSPRGAENLDLELLERLAGKDLREVAVRNDVVQASEEDQLRLGIVTPGSRGDGPEHPACSATHL
jgi:pimeloyl-ACP methyl ester carboxylesterase